MPSTADVDRSRSRTDPSSVVAVEWGPITYDRTRSAILGVVLVAIVAFVALLLLATGAFVFGDASSDGLWILALLLVIGGPFSALYWLLAYDRSSAEKRRSIRSGLSSYVPTAGAYRKRWVLVGALATVVAWLVAPDSVRSPLFVFLLVPSLSFALPLVGSEGVSYRVDPESATVERTIHAHDRTRTDDLGSAVRTRRIDLPRLTLFLVAYRGTAWYRSTPTMIVPRTRADAVEAALDAAIERSDGPSRASLGERVALAVLGGGTLAVGVALGVAAGETGVWVVAVALAPVSIGLLALSVRL